VTSLKKYNLQGDELGTVAVADQLVEARAESQLVKDYLIALRANVRSWTACTKTRAEVKHTTKKPSPQKGQGNARHGNLVAPQYRGGGRAFGPKPKFDVRLRMNRQERKAAIRALIAEKIREGKMIVVDSFDMQEPKTKSINELFKCCDCGRRVLVLGEGSFIEIGGESKRSVSVPSLQHENLKKSVRNMQRVDFQLVKDINGYQIALAQNLVISQSALEELIAWLS